MLFDERTALSAWLVVVVFWLYVVVLVVSCSVHWWHIYKKVQMNKIKKEKKKDSNEKSSMIRSMCSIRALQGRADSVAEMTHGSSNVPYMDLKDNKKMSRRSKSYPNIVKERRGKVQCNTSF